MGNKDKRGQSCTRPSSPHQDIKLTKSTVGAGTTSKIVKVIELNNPQIKEESKGTNYHFNLLTKTINIQFQRQNLSIQYKPHG